METSGHFVEANEEQMKKKEQLRKLHQTGQWEQVRN